MSRSGDGSPREMPMMSQAPKHFVFLACPPGTRLSGNSVATSFAAITRPENPATFLCHWINRTPVRQPRGSSSTTLFQDCPKVVMLLNRRETGRLIEWCRRSFPRTGQLSLYAPKIITQFYGFIRDVDSMYIGICQVRCNPQHGLYWWTPPALGLPFVAGVRWTESTCQFFRMPFNQAQRLDMALTGLQNLGLASSPGPSPSPGYTALTPRQTSNAAIPGDQTLVSPSNRIPSSSRGITGVESSGDDAKVKTD
ncbi:hypothetical protein LZ30DRAFT_467062 [Colletotrichum cereale]|nr:hypothetical protein LZ30DRAFT_467062 [Colletotrichum cereale]